MKEKIKLFFAIFTVVILFGASLSLWFMIYSDSAKNKSVEKKSLTKNQERESIDFSKNEEKENIGFSDNEEGGTLPVDSQDDITENFTNIKRPANTLNRNTIPTVDNKPEEKKEEAKETIEKADNEEDGEEETKDGISVEVESTD